MPENTKGSLPVVPSDGVHARNVPGGANVTTETVTRAHTSPPTVAPPPRVFVAWPQMVCSALGFALSLYAYHVHLLILAGEKTGCGITETISCDQVIGSKYGVIFGIPLGIYGAAFFGVMALMAVSSLGNTKGAALQRLLLALVGGAGSVVLEFIMWVLLHHACPVCMSIHLICFINLGFAVMGYSKFRGARNSN